MKKKFKLALGLYFTIVSSTLYAQNCAMSFTNPQINSLTNKYRVTLTIASISAGSWELGNQNLRFNYPVNCLSNPTIVSNFLPGTGYNYGSTTTTGSNLTTGVLSFNTTLPYGQHGKVIPSTGFDIMTIEWNITDLNGLSNPANKMYWRPYSGPSPKLALVTSTLTVGCSGGCAIYTPTLYDLAPLYQGTVKVNVKAFLSGTFDRINQKMIDEPRTDRVMPLKEPFTQLGYQLKSGANSSIGDSLNVLSDYADNSIVDWILLELRSKTNPATVLASKPFLIQIDGDIVELDGKSTPTFTNVAADQYYVVVRHRNHLGCRTLNAIQLSSTTTSLNFTNNSMPLNGSFPVISLGNGLYGMISGDANHDGSVDGLDNAEFEIQNGYFHLYIMNADFNLDNSIDAFDTIEWASNNGRYEEIN